MKLRQLRRLGLVVTVASAPFLAGCAAGGGRSNPFSGDRNEPEIKIFVTNLAFSDVTLHAFTNGGRWRLGQIMGKKEIVFTMPLRAPSEMYLEIDFLAGPTCLTERMVVDPGDHLELIIQNDNLTWACRGTETDRPPPDPFAGPPPEAVLKPALRLLSAGPNRSGTQGAPSEERLRSSEVRLFNGCWIGISWTTTPSPGPHRDRSVLARSPFLLSENRDQRGGPPWPRRWWMPSFRRRDL